MMRYRCCICNERYVDAENGFDTCDVCLTARRMSGRRAYERIMAERRRETERLMRSIKGCDCDE